MRSIQDLLNSYPRVRPPLGSLHRAIYEREYKSNRNGGRPIEAAAKKMEAWMHRQLRVDDAEREILELGAGTLNHLAFERATKFYDIVEPFSQLFQGSHNLPRVRSVYSCLADIPANKTYDFIISVAVLEHMDDLPSEIARCCIHMRPDAEFRAGIPSEGGLLWWIGWRLTTGLSYWLRNRLDYGELLRHEHLNTAPEILSIVRYFFEHVEIKRFPTPFHQGSFYTLIRAVRPRLPIAREFLNWAH